MYSPSGAALDQWGFAQGCTGTGIYYTYKKHIKDTRNIIY